MKRISDYSLAIEQAIKELAYPSENLPTLYEPIAYGLAAGGKRLRPVMVMMAAEAFGGEEAARKSLNVAVGYETFHNFTLLHDDVMDHSDLRRGRPSVHAKWDENTAILSGDTMLTLATELISDVEESNLRETLTTFNHMAIEVYEGQRLDMDFEERDEVAISEYLTMVGKKTGALIAAALKTGAIIGGASAEDAENMYVFGMELGIAFQMEDDWLDTFGDAATFGKPIGGDIRNNKKTYLMAKAYERTDEESNALRSAMKIDNLELRVKTATRLLEKMGIKEEVRRDIAATSSKAMTALKRTSLGEEQKDAFRHLAEKLATRKS